MADVMIWYPESAMSRRCGLEGPLPGQWASLKNLTYLDLSDNPSISGSLPGIEPFLTAATQPEECVPNAVHTAVQHPEARASAAVGGLAWHQADTGASVWLMSCPPLTRIDVAILTPCNVASALHCISQTQEQAYGQ